MTITVRFEGDVVHQQLRLSRPSCTLMKVLQQFGYFAHVMCAIKCYVPAMANAPLGQK
jgi:hypothetical protein